MIPEKVSVKVKSFKVVTSSVKMKQDETLFTTKSFVGMVGEK